MIGSDCSGIGRDKQRGKYRYRQIDIASDDGDRQRYIDRGRYQIQVGNQVGKQVDRQIIGYINKQFDKSTHK